MTNRLLALCALYILMLGPALALADDAENRAIKAIMKLGGQLSGDPKVDFYQVIGVDLLGNQVTDAALKEYQRGLSYDPKNETLQIRILETMIGSGRIQDAQNTVDHLLKQDPGDTTARIYMASSATVALHKMAGTPSFCTSE